MSSGNHNSMHRGERGLATDELWRRPERAHDPGAELRALVTLAESTTDEPDTILGALADVILWLCDAGSAGVSVLEPGIGNGVFRRVAVAGKLRHLRGSAVPREDSPCDIVLARGETMLFRDLAAHFPMPRDVHHVIHEALVVPFFVDGEPAGAVWALSHDAARRFDRTDAELLVKLARFAAVGHRLSASLAAARDEASGSDARYHSLFESMAEGLCVFDVAGDAFFVAETNPAFQRITGLPFAPGTRLTDLTPALSSRWQAHLDRVVHEDAVVRFTDEQPQRGRHFECTAFRVRGRGHQVAVLLTDVTERKRATEALAANERRMTDELEAMKRLHALSVRVIAASDLGDLLTEILDAAVVMSGSAQGMVQVYDPATRTLTIVASRGLAGDFVDRHLVLSVDHDTACCRSVRDKARVFIEDVWRAPRYGGDAAMSLAAGHRSVCCTPLVSRDGDVVGVISTYASDARTAADRDLRMLDLYARLSADLLDRMRASEALRASEERYRNLVNDSPDAVVVHRHGTALFANPAALALCSVPDVQTLTRRDIATQLAQGQIEGATRSVPVDVVSSLVVWDGERAVQSTFRDVSERLRVLEAEQLARTNDQLREEARARAATELVRTDLQRRLATAQEDERRRISRDLHDSIGQSVAALSLALKGLESGGGAPLADVRRMAEALGREVHQLAVELRPTALDDLGLSAAIAHHAANWSQRTGLSVDVLDINREDGRFPPEVETVFYRVTQEALTNIHRHANAKQVNIVIEHHDGQAIVAIEDDGCGFDASAPPPRDDRHHLGLLGLRERLALLGGELEVESSPGRGTTLLARVPVAR